MRSRSPRINVPFPTPEGPVITITRGICLPPVPPPAGRGSCLPPPHEGDQLAPLALGEATHRLARRDLALREDLVHLHPAVLGDGEQQVEDLGRLQELRRGKQQLVDRLPAGLEIALELGAPGADVVGALKGLHPLYI